MYHAIYHATCHAICRAIYHAIYHATCILSCTATNLYSYKPYSYTATYMHVYVQLPRLLGDSTVAILTQASALDLRFLSTSSSCRRLAAARCAWRRGRRNEALKFFESPPKSVKSFGVRLWHTWIDESCRQRAYCEMHFTGGKTVYVETCPQKLLRFRGRLYDRHIRFHVAAPISRGVWRQLCRSWCTWL